MQLLATPPAAASGPAQPPPRTNRRPPHQPAWAAVSHNPPPPPTAQAHCAQRASPRRLTARGPHREAAPAHARAPSLSRERAGTARAQRGPSSREGGGKRLCLRARVLAAPRAGGAARAQSGSGGGGGGWRGGREVAAGASVGGLLLASGAWRTPMLAESIEPGLSFVPAAPELVRMAVGVPECFWSVLRGGLGGLNPSRAGALLAVPCPRCSRMGLDMLLESCKLKIAAF